MQHCAVFCGPDTKSAIDAVTSVAELLPTTQLNCPTIIIRAHPRAPQEYLLEQLANQFSHLLYNAVKDLNTPSLLASSRLSLSMASTVSLESLVMGIPSAYYQIGWDYKPLDSLYRNIREIPRIRTACYLNRFVNRTLSPSNKFLSNNLELHRGALTRSWQVINELI